MQPQQKPDRRSFIIQFLILYIPIVLLMQFFWTKNAPAPPEGAAGTLLEIARKQEEAGRKSDPNVPHADRVKSLHEAIRTYERHAQQNPKSPEGIQSEFQIVNLHDFLARLEPKSGTHWLDQSEARLKQLEKKFHGQQGKVSIERKGRVTEEEGDLSAIATRRLNDLRADRSAMNRSKWTYRSLDALVALTGRQPEFSYALALLIIVVIFKGLTHPLQKRQHRYMQDMARVQPLLKAAQEKYKDKPQELNKRVFEIYKENNVNLAGGCLPMLVLMFGLFPVFWMIRDYEYQFTNGFFLWIGTPFSREVWWLGDNLAQFDLPLFVGYLASLVLYSLLQPRSPDPQAAQQQKMMLWMMPIISGWFMWAYQWSSAFMLYWFILNIVGMKQSWLLNKQFGPMTHAVAPVAAEVVSPGMKPLPSKAPAVEAASPNGKGPAAAGSNRKTRAVRRNRPKKS